MNHIFKYDASETGSYSLPITAKVVHVAHQGGSFPTIWAEIYLLQDDSTKLLQAVGTGHQYPATHNHVGSAICGAYVWHVIEPG